MDRPVLTKWLRSPRDYWKIGPFYIWKWLFLLLAGAAASLVLWVFGLPAGPWAGPAPDIPTYRYDDPELRDTSGVARILDDQDRVRYEGEVAAGAYTGQGRVYDDEGRLVYDGPVVDGVYEGENAKVYSDGLLIYEGAMAANLYDGEGRRIDPETGIVSEGAFSAGVFEGEGRQFYPDGALLRSGTFKKELLNGEGREYSEDGVLLREGTFQNGLLHGAGAQYTSGGVLEYEGAFHTGIFHGQGALYDTLDQALVYEGEFVRGEATGLGRLRHPSGQLLYEGQVYQGRPRADAFLGLSLAEVESAFKEHWSLYSCEGTTAFVYPHFRLMFITEAPARLVSPSQQEARTERKQRELLEAIAAQAEQSRPSEEGDAEVPAAAEPVGDMELSRDTVKADVPIAEVLSYGAPLAGVAQPEPGPPSGTRKTGWREWFSDFAAGEALTGAAALQTGPFVYEFTALTAALPDTDYYLASGRGVESTTARRSWKDSPVWYQSAVRREDGA